MSCFFWRQMGRGTGWLVEEDSKQGKEAKERERRKEGKRGILQLGEGFDRGGETQQSPCGFQLERSLSRKL